MKAAPIEEDAPIGSDDSTGEEGGVEDSQSGDSASNEESKED